MKENEKVVLDQRWEDGKFVQLLIKTDMGDVPIFASKDRAYLHAEIVSKRLEELSIPYEFTIDRLNGSLENPIKLANKEGKDYCVVGAGALLFHKDKKTKKQITIYINSDSAGYNLGFNSEHFEQVRGYFPRDLEVILARHQ